MNPFHMTIDDDHTDTTQQTKTHQKQNKSTNQKLLSIMNPFHMTIDDDHTDTTQVH